VTLVEHDEGPHACKNNARLVSPQVSFTTVAGPSANQVNQGSGC